MVIKKIRVMVFYLSKSLNKRHWNKKYMKKKYVVELRLSKAIMINDPVKLKIIKTDVTFHLRLKLYHKSYLFLAVE